MTGFVPLEVAAPAAALSCSTIELRVIGAIAGSVSQPEKLPLALETDHERATMETDIDHAPAAD